VETEGPSTEKKEVRASTGFRPRIEGSTHQRRQGARRGACRRRPGAPVAGLGIQGTQPGESSVALGRFWGGIQHPSREMDGVCSGIVYLQQRAKPLAGCWYRRLGLC
jgi:hypothetical protein